MYSALEAQSIEAAWELLLPELLTLPCQLPRGAVLLAVRQPQISLACSAQSYRQVELLLLLRECCNITGRRVALKTRQNDHNTAPVAALQLD